MAEFNHKDKEAAMAMAESNFGEDEMEQDIASPVDCWELVGSSPGSPLPNARVDVTALEQAVASACNSGSSLQDNYFSCVPRHADDEFVPPSTAVADNQDDDDGRSSERSDTLVSFDSDADMIENCTIHNDGMCHHEDHGNAELMGCNNGEHINDHVHHNSASHDDLPYHSNPMCHGDQVKYGVDALHDSKMSDELMMFDNNPTEQDNRWHIKDKTYLESIMHTEGGNSVCCINQSGTLCEVVESTAFASVHSDVCTLGLSGLESPSAVPMPSQGMGDNDMTSHQIGTEGSSSTVRLEETGREVTSQVMQVQGSVDAQHNRRLHKGFMCASWVWTQLIRWQTQLGHVNTIWSAALAAAVMGILVLGRGWLRLHAQNQSLRSQLWAKEKRITQLMFQLMQTKESLAKVRRVPVICVKPSLKIPQDNC